METSQTQLQLRTIEQVTAILKKYDSVVATALYGSHAEGANTDFSDIDLLVVFKDDERKDVEKIFNDIVAIKPTLSALYQLFDKESLILFEDGVRLDLKMEKRSDFDKWVLQPVKILFDHDGILDQMIQVSKNKAEAVTKPRWNDKEGNFVDWFFWMFRQAYCYMYQSEAVSKKSFEKKDLAVGSIKIIRDRLLESLYYTNGKRDYLANIDEELLKKFQSTYSCNSIGEMRSSINYLVELYELIIDRYCSKEGIEFPKQKIIQMKKVFIEFDKSANFPVHP